MIANEPKHFLPQFRGTRYQKVESLSVRITEGSYAFFQFHKKNVTRSNKKNQTL